MADYLKLDANRVRATIARLIEAYPDLADDEDLRADTIEGETDLDTILTRLFIAWRSDEEMATGTKSIIADLRERKDRLERRVDAKKALAMSLLETADLDKRQLPVATLSIRSGRESVVVDDVDQLPQGAFTLIRKPIDAADLKKQIMAEKAGDFPGAHLEIGDDTLAARAK